MHLIIIRNKIFKALKTNKLLSIAAAALMLVFGAKASAQDNDNHVLSTLRTEARADFETNGGDYGFVGRYFNLHAGGQLGDKFSYYFRHRIITTTSEPSLFDNTDFLHLTYKINDNWSLRAGKDALAVGGYEYDAAPIDVLFNGVYWDNFYCFQMMGRVMYKTNDGNHNIWAEVGASPYINTTALNPAHWKSGLMSYNLFWSGSFGHFHTLYSVNFFEYERGRAMNYIALGNKVQYEKWGLYLDLMHHAFATDDWGKNFGIVSRFDYDINGSWKLFLKGSYEQNRSNYPFNMAGTYDCLVPEHHTFGLYGGGFEFRPASCKSVRLHGFVAYREDKDYTPTGNPYAEIPVASSSLSVNFGLSWNMDFMKMINK